MIAIAALIPLAIIGGIIAGITVLAKRNDTEPPDGLVRRLVVSALTFGMTIVLLTGLFTLLDIVFSSADVARSGSADIARGLAMTLVGGPVSFLLWRYQLKALAGPDGRSIVWLLYQGIAALTFSIGTVIALGNGLRFDDFDSRRRSALAFAIVWGAGWLFHQWVGRRHPVVVLPGLPQAIGGGVGLITMTFGAVSLIAAVIDPAAGDVLASTGRFDDIIAGLIWTAVGAGVWIWQFVLHREQDTWSRNGLVLGVGVGGGTLLALGGATALVTLLFASVQNGFEMTEISDAVAATAVGFLVWRYHHTLLGSPVERRIGRHLISGLSVIGMAVGIGVVVNYGLSALTPAFASRNENELLWAGLGALVVNAPVWWFSWRPDRQPDPDTGSGVQRIYLTVLGGVAGVVGAIALIYLIFQLLEGIFDGDSVGAIVDGIRAPLGFVVATGLITAYHYRRWASSRVQGDEPEPVTVERVTFVGAAQEITQSLRNELGVRTTEWQSAGEGRVLSADELIAHLRSLDATDVLVVEEERGYRVIRLLRSDGQRPQTGEPQE